MAKTKVDELAQYVDEFRRLKSENLIPEEFNTKKKKSTQPTSKPQSPYFFIKQWLVNPMPDGDVPKIPMEVLKAINQRSILAMFGGLGNITVFLNSTFNNYNVMNIDQMEFYFFLRSIIKRFNINIREFVGFYAKKDKTIHELHMKFPELKNYEIEALLERIKGDDECNAFADSLGLTELKKEKLTKQEKTKLVPKSEEAKPKTQTKKKIETKPSTKTKKPISMNELEALFHG